MSDPWIFVKDPFDPRLYAHVTPEFREKSDAYFTKIIKAFDNDKKLAAMFSDQVRRAYNQIIEIYKGYKDFLVGQQCKTIPTFTEFWKFYDEWVLLAIEESALLDDYHKPKAVSET